MFVDNHNNSQIGILDRKAGKRLSALRQRWKRPGRFGQPHAVAVDSKGNVCAAENFAADG
jgi:hypothetical protein